MSNRLRVAACALLLTASSFAGTIIHVPANQPTIQAGINAASNGDTVLVAPGTYYENINFIGKAITVASSNGAKVTIIDGGNVDSVVIFDSHETTTSVLQGFTLTHGLASSSFGGGGVRMYSSAATITGNTITGNQACYGGGIYEEQGTPVIAGNVITNNSASCGGGGIELDGTTSAQVLNNTVSNNSSSLGGGGIVIEGSFGQALISGNLIRANVAQTQGGGIHAYNGANALVIQNVISNNRAGDGAGIDWLVGLNSQGPTMTNNTLAGNILTTSCGGSCQMQGSAVFLDGFYGQSVFYNNLLIAKNGESAFYCANDFSSTAPTMISNDAYSSGGTGFDLICSGASGTNGNISASPQFVGASNFRLKGGSPAIDSGNNSAPNLPTKDFANNPRIINGNGLATAIVDTGAYEFVPVVLAPKSLSFGLQAVGSSTSKTVKLTNAQNKALNVSSYTVPTGYSVSGCGSSIAAFTSCTLTVTFHPLTSGTLKGLLVVKDDAGNSPQTVSLSGSAH